MKFIDAAQHRYATKMYDNSKKIEKQKMQELKQILHLSPSSINGQPWQFTFVHDTNTKAKLAEASFFNEGRIKDCDTLIVFSAIDNTDVFEKQITEHLVEGAVNYFNTVVKPQGDVFIKNWFQKQVYLSLGIFLGACATMEIDATPMEGIEANKYDAIINPDGNYTALFSVAVGYRNLEDSFQPNKRPKERVEFDKIIRSI